MYLDCLQIYNGVKHNTDDCHYDLCCSVLQCVAVCCSVLQCIAVQCKHYQALLCDRLCEGVREKGWLYVSVHDDVRVCVRRSDYM